MALMDPYGLTLFSVAGAGALVLGVTEQSGFIVGRSWFVARGRSLGRNRGAHPAASATSAIAAHRHRPSPIRESWIAATLVGIFAFMLVIPVIEGAGADDLTSGSSRSRSSAASWGSREASRPRRLRARRSSSARTRLSCPALIPFMASSSGQKTFSWLLGDGAGRGMALAFVVASTITLITVTAAFSSAAYRRLSSAYAAHSPSAPASTLAVAESTDPELAAA